MQLAEAPPETPRPEPSRPGAVQLEAIKLEAPRPELPRPEAPRLEAPHADASRPAVAGFVDDVTEAVAWGWAWTPGQAAPLAVELRLGAEVVAETLADTLREDLARLGLGAGRHAFKLAVPEACRPRLAELRVFARTADGGVVPLGTAPAARTPEDHLAERLAQLTRGMETLIGSQRVLHRNVQALLLAGSQGGQPAQAIAPEAAPAPDAPAAPDALREGLETLELFVARLELGLAGLSPPQQAAAPRWALLGVAAAAALALLLSAWALILALPG